MSHKDYEEYQKDVRKQLIKRLKELSEFMDVSEIPLDYCPERPYELLSYLEDLIEAFEKKEKLK
jgi:hypothetical protein